jgi:hypothetical protein
VLPLNGSFNLTTKQNMQSIAADPLTDVAAGLFSPNYIDLYSHPIMNFIIIDKQFNFFGAALHHDTYDIA